MKRCCLHVGHPGPHLFVNTKSTMVLSSDCTAKPKGLQPAAAGRYQARKARLIAAALLIAACQSSTPHICLAGLTERMNERQWISVSFAAGVAVADVRCRALVVAMLEGLA